MKMGKNDKGTKNRKSSEEIAFEKYKKEMLANREKREKLYLPFFLRTKNFPFKIILFLAVVVFFFVCMSYLLEVFAISYASETEENGWDIVLVIDTSVSMKNTDPDRLALEASKLFIDMLEKTDSRVAIVPFSDEIGEVIPFTKVNLAESKESIKSAIDVLKYNGKWTDIGLALNRGYKIFNQDNDSGNQKVMVLFTDGNIELLGSLRTALQSFDDTLKIAKKAEEENIPIYTIGLNSNNRVDKELITLLADQTNGKKYIVNSAKSLSSVFTDIIADFIDSNLIFIGQFETDRMKQIEIPFAIPDYYVSEANIIILSDIQPDDIQLIHPNGNKVSFNTESVLLEQSQNYLLLKLYAPTKGDWCIQLKEQKKGKADANLLLNYQIDLKCKAEIRYDKTEPYIDIVSWFEENGERISDADFYKEFCGDVYFLSEPASDSERKRYPMSVEEDAFYTMISDKLLTEYEGFFIQVENKSIYRKSEVIDSKSINHAPNLRELPDKIELSGFITLLGKKKMDIASYITDEDGDKIKVSAEVLGGNHLVSIEEKEGIFLFRPRKNGIGNMVILAKDEKGTESRKIVTISVNYKINALLSLLRHLSFLPILLIGLFLIFFSFLVRMVILILKKRKTEKNASLFGKIQWRIVGDENNQQVYPLYGEKGYLPLEKLVAGAERTEMNLKKTMIHMNDTLDGVIIFNGTRRWKMLCSGKSSPVHKAAIYHGESVLLNGKRFGKEWSIQITYLIR